MASGLSRRRPSPLLVLLHVWLLLPHVLPAIVSTSKPEFLLSWGQVSTSATPLQSVHVFSLLQCAIQCHTLPSCWAFNHRSSGLCQLLPRDLQLCQVSGELQPLTAEEGGVFGMPAVGCAVRTCLELLQLNVTAASGVYWLPGWPVPVFCDQQQDGGGWTLMVSSVSQTWTPAGSGVTLVTGRNTETPSIEDDYSILAEGDRVIRYGTGDRFIYRSVLRFMYVHTYILQLGRS